MTRELTKCPVCQHELQIGRLSCPDCGAEYPVQKPLSPYDNLSQAQATFLSTFLRCRGNLKLVGQALSLSYPAVKRQLDNLLDALGYGNAEKGEAELDMSQVNYTSTAASDIIKRKLYEHNGAVTIPLLNGDVCKVSLVDDGSRFTSDKLGVGMKYDFWVFDVIVTLLFSSKDGRALKGNGHGKEDKVGAGKCTSDTVMGAIAIHYFKKKAGESTFDPVFVLAAMLDWAGIAKNCRGYLELDNQYRQQVVTCRG